MCSNRGFLSSSLAGRRLRDRETFLSVRFSPRGENQTYILSRKFQDHVDSFQSLSQPKSLPFLLFAFPITASPNFFLFPPLFFSIPVCPKRLFTPQKAVKTGNFLFPPIL